MSYLILPAGISSSRTAVASIWFRIPQASYDKVIAQSNTPTGIAGELTDPQFFGAIPVVTWGPQFDAGFGKSSSSWIGVCYNQQSGAGSTDFGLAFNLQFNTTGSCTPDYYLTGVPENIMLGVTLTASANIFEFPDPILVSPDKWHHVLLAWTIDNMSTRPSLDSSSLSLDYSGGITGGATIYVALDDKNIVTTPDESLKFWPCGGYKGGNTFITVSAYNIAQLNTGRDDSPSFSWGGDALPMSPLGLPTAGKIEFNRHCELAEFQLFTGVTLNTASTVNRRAFIGPDKSGKKSGLVPVDPKQARSLLGKKQDVLLHGNGNWIKGKNTGSDGQFSPTGKIKKYTPDPQLGK